MPLPLVTLTGAFVQAGGTPAQGSVTFTPTAEVAYTANGVILGLVPATVMLDGTGAFSTQMLATDAVGLSPTGWGYNVNVQLLGAGAQPNRFAIQLPSSPNPVDLSALAPAALSGTPLYQYVLATTVGKVGGPAGPLDAGGKIPVSQSPGSGVPAVSVTDETTFGVAPAVGTATNYARQDHTHGSPALGTSGTTAAVGNDTRIVGAAQKASNLADLASAVTARTNLGLGGAAVLAVGTTIGTVAAGDDSRIVGAAQKAANLSDLGSVVTARTNLGLGTAAVAAIDTTSTDIAPLGTQAAGATGKVGDAGHVHAMPRLDQLVAPTAAVPLNAQKITGLAAGVVATDAANVGQLPASLPPSGAAGGDLAGGYPNPTLSGTANVNTVVRANRLDQMAAPTAAVGLNSQKITSLANGALATDAAAVGQIPTALPPNGAASGDLGATYPAPQVTATHLAAPLPLAQGGTAAATAAAALTSLGAAPAARLLTAGTGLSGGGDLTADRTLAVVFDTVAADIAPLGTQAAGAVGKVADSGHVHAMPRLDQVAAPTAAVALNAQKITGLANGAAVSDGAAFGQIAAAITAGIDTLAADITAVGTSGQIAGAVGKTADAGHGHQLSQVVTWAPTTAYARGQLITWLGFEYQVTTAFTSGATFALTNLRMLSAPMIGTIVPPGMYAYAGASANVGSAATLSNNTGRAFPVYLPHDVTLTRIGAEVVTIGQAGSKYRLAIYSDTGGFLPGTLVLDAGQIAGDVAGFAELTISQFLSAGVFWLEGTVQLGATTQPTMRTFVPASPSPVFTSAPTGGAAGVFESTVISAGAPATFTVNGTTGTVPRIHLKA